MKEALIAAAIFAALATPTLAAEVSNANAAAGADSTSVSTNAGNNAAQQVGGQTATNVANFEGSRFPASTAVAPQLNFSADTCYASGSAGAQSFGAGATIGIPFKDKSCERRANARELQQLGETEAAIQYMSAGDPEISEAITAARRNKMIAESGAAH